MTKINLVIASLLKPIDDTRMYEKFGITLADTQKYCVNIIGYQSTHLPSHANINFFPVFSFSRKSYKRFIAPLKYYKILLKLKPSIVIVQNPELLIVTIIYKILYGCRMLYDVQENYYYNILYVSRIKGFTKYFLATLYRTIEFISSPFIAWFFLAEKSYVKELSFIQKKFAVLENKYAAYLYDLGNPKKRSYYHLVYTGTIAESFGIYAAIHLVKKLYKEDSRYHLTIIGYCADETEFTKFINVIAALPFVRLIGGNYPVPHAQIIEVIRSGDVGLVSYLPNESTRNKIPTKLYEYIYNRLPFILPINDQWEAMCRPYNAAILTNYTDVNVYEMLLQLHTYPFYSDVSPTLFADLVWEKSILLRNIE